MNPIHKILTLTWIVLAVNSCSKQKTITAPELYGTWKWVRTDGGIANNIHETPASSGKNIDLTIKNDQTYSIFTNGVLTSRGTYTLELRNCIHDHTQKKVINFSATGDPDMMIENLNRSELELSDENFDGVGSLYSKK